MREVLFLHASTPTSQFLTDGWDWEWGRDPDLWWYRDRTIALLKRYMRLSVEVGRLPSLLGPFEDVVIFVHDVERSLEKLDGFSPKLIAKIVLQEYSESEAARLPGCSLRHVERYFPQALDQLSETFLKGDPLKPMEDIEPEPPETCQEDEIDENDVSCGEDGKNIF